MKKIISIFLCLTLALCCFSMSVSAAENNEKITLYLKSDLSGATYENCERFIEIKSGNIVLDTVNRDDPVFVSSYVGDVYLDELKSGRTYYVDYTFIAKEGTLPDEINDSNIEFICDKGCEALWYSKAVGTGADGSRIEVLLVNTKVQVNGNFFQRLFGKIADAIAKILAWSPY
ncbi:MAG: hypothetical protein MJ120_00335 [Clostridia bacterium]|nr:hypothetical protein [Clostridia bacterium]